MSSTTVSSDELYDTNEYYDFSNEVIEDYCFICSLGKGSSASVWLVYHIPNKDYYAIKVQNPDDYEAGVDEINVFKKLKNETDENACFIKYYNNFVYKSKSEDGNRKYLMFVFELCSCTLHQLIKKQYKNGLPEKLINLILYKISYTVDLLHKKYKIFHADLKTDNILITGLTINQKAIINRYNELNFHEKYSEIKNKYLIKKGVDLNNNNQIKKYLNKDVKHKLKHIVHNSILNEMKLILDEFTITGSDEDSSSIEHISDNSNSNKKNNNSESSNKKTNSESESEESDSDENSEEYEDLHNSDLEVFHFSSEDDDEHFIDIDENNFDVRLTDFGGHCDFDDSFNSQFGTRYYMAPEVILNKKHNYKVDNWALGCILYELITGKYLFDPSKDKYHSRDYYHLKAINNTFGKFPNKYIMDEYKKSSKKKSNKSSNKNSFLKNDLECSFNLKEICENKKYIRDVEKFKNYIFLDYYNTIIINLCKIDPNDRIDLNSIFDKLKLNIYE